MSLHEMSSNRACPMGEVGTVIQGYYDSFLGVFQPSYEMVKHNKLTSQIYQRTFVYEIKV